MFMNKKDRIIDFIYYIHQNIGARVPGSREEKLAARYIKSVLSQFSDKTDSQSFMCNSRSWQHEFNMVCILYCLALIGYLTYPPSAIFFILLYGVHILLIKIYDIKVTDIWLSKNKSQNIIANIKPYKEIKNTIIFAAHTDSAYTTELYDTKYRNYLTLINRAFPSLFGLLLFITLINIFKIADVVIDYLYLLPFLAIGAVIYFQNKFVKYEKSFGANNDLSGISINIELAKHFFINRTNNTEIIIANFGAKEADFAGSKNFLKNNLDLLKKSIVINMESVAGGELNIISQEKSIVHDKETVKILVEASQKANIKLNTAKSDIITTDAGVFSYEKIKAVSFLSFDKYGIPLRYCLKEDVPQYIFEEDLQNVFKICVKFVELIDER